MTEIIKEILEVTQINDYVHESFSGFKVITTQQTIGLYIDNVQDCCEHWGYFMSNDNLQDFVGSELLSIELTDTALNTIKMDKEDLPPTGKYWEGGIMFVNLNTSVGVLQFVAYNEHNGYYGHSAKIVSSQLTHEEIL